jgi:hypothetical protein
MIVLLASKYMGLRQADIGREQEELCLSVNQKSRKYSPPAKRFGDTYTEYAGSSLPASLE